MKSSRKSPRHKFPWLRLGQLLLLVILGGGVLGLMSLFRVHEIECQDQRGNCSEEILTSLNSLKGQNIFRVDLPTFFVQQPALGQVHLAEYHKILPNTITVAVTQSQTSYQVMIDSELLTINQSGKLASVSTDQTPLPQIVISDPSLAQKITDQSRVSPSLHQALLLVAQFLKTQSETTQAELVNDHTIIITLPDHPQFILEPSMIDIQLARLKVILNDMTAIPVDTEQIDLRFKDPVAKPYKYSDDPIKIDTESFELETQTASESSESSSTQSPEI